MSNLSVCQQDDSEKYCCNHFVKYYNQINDTNYTKIEKNPIQNEVDIFCYDETKNYPLKIQVKRSDSLKVGALGLSKKIPLIDRPLIIADNEKFPNRILNDIRLVEEKYAKQGKDMTDIILLFDEMWNPSLVFIEKAKLSITKSTFKEIWIILRNGSVFRLF